MVVMSFDLECRQVVVVDCILQYKALHFFSFYLAKGGFKIFIWTHKSFWTPGLSDRVLSNRPCLSVYQLVLAIFLSSTL